MYQLLAIYRDYVLCARQNRPHAFAAITKPTEQYGAGGVKIKTKLKMNVWAANDAGRVSQTIHVIVELKDSEEDTAYNILYKKNHCAATAEIKTHAKTLEDI